jgi:hypothetical protein
VFLGCQNSIFRRKNSFEVLTDLFTKHSHAPLSRNHGCEQVALPVLISGRIDGAISTSGRQAALANEKPNENFRNESIERGQKTEFKQKINQDGRHFVNIVHCSVFINCVIRRNSAPIGVIDTIDASENCWMRLCQK